MSHEYELSLTIEGTGEIITLSGAFSDSDWERLEAFVQYAEELLNSKFIQEGDGGQLSMQWHRETGLSVTARLPPWDDVIVFLHKFRPLLLLGESTSFYNIHSLLGKTLDHHLFRGILTREHELYSGKNMQSKLKITSNDAVLNSEKVLFDWLNSHEYHRNKEKQEFIASLHQMMPLDASKVVFLQLLVDKAFAVFNLAAFIQVVLGRSSGFSTALKQA
jgi:hypothetical protein